MSIMLPKLDDRRWQDLRDEAVTLIPRLAPDWTDHNITDPGITLLELLAYHTEADLFRLDQIGAPHYHAFLQLFGRSKLPRGPRPASTLLVYEPDSPKFIPTPIMCGECLVPRQPPSRYRAGQRVREQPIPPAAIRQAGEPDEPMLHNDLPMDRIPVPEFGFRAAHELDLTRIRLGAVQSFDGSRFVDITEILGVGKAVAVWGDDPAARDTDAPEQQPALYLGLDMSRFDPNGVEKKSLTLWFIPDGHSAASLVVPPTSRFQPQLHPMTPDHANCRKPVSSCKLDETKAYQSYDPEGVQSQHHDVHVQWEYFADKQWKPVHGSAFRDETRAFTLPGRVVIPLSMLHGGPALAVVKGSVPAEHVYLRCRLVMGRPDQAPRLSGIFVNAVLVEQWQQNSSRVSSSLKTVHGMEIHSEVESDINDAMDDLGRQGWEPEATRWRDFPLQSLASLWKSLGLLSEKSVFVQAIGVGTGLPGQRIALPVPVPSDDQPRMVFSDKNQLTEDPVEWHVIPETLQVWTLEPPWRHGPGNRIPLRDWQACSWLQVPELGMHARTSNVYQYCPQLNEAQVSSPGYLQFSDGGTGRVPPNGAIVFATWRYTLAEAANFAADFLWARATDHDQILQDGKPRVTLFPEIRFRNVLSAEGGRPAESLDEANDQLFDEFEATRQQLPGAQQGLESTELPAMAITLRDFEILARSTPGTVVKRSAAWAEVDPRFPHAVVPGAVTVAILPELPLHRPEPTPALLERVKAWLLERRPLACRLQVIAPVYLGIRVKATLHVLTGRVDNVKELARTSLTDYLHPLRGGTDHQGWPFGKDVHAGDLLRLLAGLQDVYHVTDVQLSQSGVTWSKDYVRIPAMVLPQLGLEDIELELKEIA